jgi:hypothetical protein
MEDGQNIALRADACEAALVESENTHPSHSLTDENPSRLGFDPVAVAYRSDGWTPDRQRAFIEELADCGIVSDAAARVGMTERSANRLRRRTDARSFSLAWDAAVRMGGERLRSVAFDRAINGSLRRRYYHGEVVDEERVYDNRLLTYLLGRLPALPAPVPWECDPFLATADHGLPAPATIDAPIWRTEDGSWRTAFPPSTNFTGEQHGVFGDRDYHRKLTAGEQVVVEAWIARKRERESRARDLYFDRLR